MLLPEPLRPGDRVRIVAPSGPFDRALVLRGIGWLGERYRVEYEPGLFDKQGFLAGSDQRRLNELESALSAPGIAAVISARGGYGLTRILHRAELTALVRAPRWLVGFSDFTALHVECARRGVASLHAANCGGLGRGHARTRISLIETLENPVKLQRHSGLEVWRAGQAEGRLFGGNLTVLFTLAASGRLFVPDDAVLLLEDVTESSYRLDRMLTALLLSGAFDRVRAVIVGDLTDCPSGPYGVTAEAAVRERLLELGVPVLARLPFGHGTENVPLVLGAPARVEAGALELFPR